MAAGGTTTLVNLLKVKSNDLLVGNGVTGTGSLRVTIASDNSALAVTLPLLNVQQFNGTAISMKAASIAAAATDTSLVVALSPNTALPAGTNAIGKLTANTGVTIGAVEIAATQTLSTVTTVSTVTSLTQMNGQAIAMGTGVRSAGTQRVTIATDDIVPVSQSGTWNINALTSITNALPAGTNNIGDVDVLTLPSIPAGTNTIGKVDVNQVYAEDVASAGGESLFLSGAVRQDTIAATTSADGDYTYLKTNNLGRLYTSTTIDAALPAGSNAIGKLAANSGVIIGAVEIAATQTLSTVTTVSTLTNQSQMGGQAIAMGTGVRSAGTQRVTIATDDLVPVSLPSIPAGTNTIGTVRLSAIQTNFGALGALNQVIGPWDVFNQKGTTVSIFSVSAPTGITVVAEVTIDGTNWVPGAYMKDATGVISSSITNAQLVVGAIRTIIVPQGAYQVRLRMSTWTSGTVNFIAMASHTDGETNLSISPNGTTSQPVSVQQVGGWDGTNLRAMSTDASGRVNIGAINSALPTGTNSIGNIGTVSTVTSLTQMNGQAIAMNTGVRSAGTQRVTIATDDVIGTVTSLTQFNGTAISMKAANVAPALADPALVVALSPNSQQLTTPSGVPSVATASTGGSLPASTTYFFKLVAVDAGGGTTIPGPEASIATAVGTATNTVTITWPPITGADSYQVWWATASGAQASYFPAPINLSTSGTLTNSYVFSTVTGTFSGTTPSTNTTSFVRQKAIQPVSGPLTDTQLRATAVPVSGSGNFTVTQATAANLNATVTGTVELGATSLAALENISVTVPGTVDLGTVSLTALETITVTSGTPNNFQSKVYGAVTTAAPAYTNATDNALSLTTSGALRVDGSAVTQPVSGTFWQATQPVSIAASVTVTGPLTSAQTLTALTTLNQFNGTAISMKAASTAAVAGDTALVVSVSPNTAVNLAADDVHDDVAGTTGVMVTGFASAATPTGVSADGDAARIWVSRNGAVIIDGYSKQGTATALAAINSTLTLQLGGSKAAGITITAISTPVGITLTPQVSFDGGTTWTATAFKNLSNGDIISTITNPNLIVGYTVSIVLGGGASHVRVIALAYGSGSGTLQWSASESVDTRELFVASNNSAQRPPSTAQVGGWDGSALRSMSTDSSGRVNIGSINVGLPAGANVIGSISNVGTVTTVSTVTNLSQLGGTAITMKAASTAAAAGDTSLVVGLSPNSPLPAGTNGIGKLTANDGIDIGDVTVNNLISNGVYSRITDGTNTMPTGDAAARGIYHRITDGTNNAAVAAASTAAAATDPALVVAVSPNSLVTVAQATAANLNATVVQATAANLNATVSIAPAQTLTTVSTVSIVGSLTQMNGQVIDMGTGVRASGTQRVTIATNDIVQTKATPDATGTYAGTNATTTVYATNLVIKASAGTVYMLSGYNSLATAQFIQLHNATALPADTSVPSVIFYVPGLSNFSFDFGVYGRFFSTGVVVCNSTTGPTKTIGAANCWFDAQFK